MNKSITLNLKGFLWLHLLTFEKTEITKVFPKLLSDPNINLYRFIKLKDGTWSIPNAMTLPLKTKSMVLSNA